MKLFLIMGSAQYVVDKDDSTRAAAVKALAAFKCFDDLGMYVKALADYHTGDPARDALRAAPNRRGPGRCCQGTGQNARHARDSRTHQRVGGRRGQTLSRMGAESIRPRQRLRWGALKRPAKTIGRQSCGDVVRSCCSTDVARQIEHVKPNEREPEFPYMAAEKTCF